MKQTRWCSWLKRGLLGISLSLLVTDLFPAEASAVNVTIDPPQSGVGSQQSADTSWANRTFLCNRWVVPGGKISDPVSTLGDGSSGNPWRSLAYAVKQARKGNNVCVAGGTYRENHFVPGATGTPTEPITFLSKGEILLVPDINQSDADQHVFDFDSNALGRIAYWVIDRFPMDRQQRNGVGFLLQGNVDHIIIQNTEIRNSKASYGVLLRGKVTDVMLRGNTFRNNQRWQLEDAGPSDPAAYTQIDSTYRRRDANAIEIEGVNVGAEVASVQRILVDNNKFYNVGGDALQCLGVDDGGPTQAGDPRNIDIVDNEVRNDVPTSLTSPITENAFDIKSCQNVSIRGRQPATGAPQGSKMRDFRATAMGRDAKGGDNNDPGTAIVVHYKARNVLIENNRIWNACFGITVGRLDSQVQNIVIRRNVIFSSRYHDAASGATSDDTSRCRGEGIHITNANRADVYNNTLDGIATTALFVSQNDSNNDGVPDDRSMGIPTNVDIWNNIMVLSDTVGAEPRRWIRLGKPGGTIAGDVDSDYNLFWRTNGATASEPRFMLGATALNLSGWRANRDSSRDAALVVADPRFVTDPMSNDYYTRPGSPARDGGLRTNEATNSWCGSALDIGFLESGC
jgi:hypothetical protein